MGHRSALDPPDCHPRGHESHVLPCLEKQSPAWAARGGWLPDTSGWDLRVNPGFVTQTSDRAGDSGHFGCDRCYISVILEGGSYDIPATFCALDPSSRRPR